jgi:hypothetical protein
MTDYEELDRLKAEARDERALESRKAKIEAELERRMSPSARQARALRGASIKLEPDSRPLEKLSTTELQAFALRGRPGEATTHGLTE